LKSSISCKVSFCCVIAGIDFRCWCCKLPFLHCS
jgi:hypothetical protein